MSFHSISVLRVGARHEGDQNTPSRRGLKQWNDTSNWKGSRKREGLLSTWTLVTCTTAIFPPKLYTVLPPCHNVPERALG